MILSFKQRGDFSNTEAFLKKASKNDFRKKLERFGEQGVRALSSATPVDTGKTASSWDYKITVTKNSTTIAWTNSNIVGGVPVAILLQYGHGTRNGGYVQGRDYINPAIQPIFDKMADTVWREVIGK